MLIYKNKNNLEAACQDATSAINGIEHIKSMIS